MNTSLLVAEAVWKDIESTHSVTDDQLSILHFLFGKNFERATRIVDQRGVKRISGHSSGRSIFQVVGESRKKEEYLCFPEHYCACYSFFYDIVNRGEQLCCKHQLAARLAASIGACIDVKLIAANLSIHERTTTTFVRGEYGVPGFGSQNDLPQHKKLISSAVSGVRYLSAIDFSTCIQAFREEFPIHTPVNVAFYRW